MLFNWLDKFRERWQRVPPDDQAEYCKRVARAKMALRLSVQDASPGGEVLSFGPPDRPGGLSFVVAVQTEEERLRLENSGTLRAKLKADLVAQGYSLVMVETMDFSFRSEEKHGIFTWLNRW